MRSRELQACATCSARRLSCALIALALLGASAAGQAKQKPVRMALSIRNISWVEPVSAKAVSSAVMETIGRKTGYDFSLDIFKNAAAMAEQLVSGEYNVGIAAALEYVQLSERMKFVPLSREFRFGRPSFKIVLLVRRDAGLKQITDLRGKKLSLSDDDPMNKVYLRVLLARNGIKNPQAFFSAVEVKSKPKAAVLDLFLQEADACLATDTVFASMAQLNPQLKTALQALHSSESISNGAIFVRPDLSKKVADDFRRVLLTLHEMPEGKQLLRIFRTPKVVSVSNEDYASARKIWQEYQALVQKP